MHPIAMALALTCAVAAFAHSANRRWRLLKIGAPAARFDRPAARMRLTTRLALAQQRLTRYRLAGLAHKAIFFGFLVLLLRSLILIARGFVSDPGFGFGIFDSGSLLGNLYSLVKDFYVLIVILGVLVFLYYRLVARPKRMTLSGEGIAILAIILVMMIADVSYDAAGHVLEARQTASADATSAPADATSASTNVVFNFWEPLGATVAGLIDGWPTGAITFLWQWGFWTHVLLVLVFLNILPYTKHFHIITGIPNVFLSDLDPPGRLRPIKDLEGRIEREETLGVRRIDQFSWKDLLDLYSCTECGRCTDHCPAANTGKLLSPKKLTTDLRDFLYRHQHELIAKAGNHDTASDSADSNGQSAPRGDLVPAVIDPEALWACTTCRACEQECPLLISYVDKIVDLRRYLVQEKGEFPSPLREAFQSLEVTGSPYAVAAEARLAWAAGLDVPVRADVEDVELLFWVGCSPATDERAQGIARAVAQLLNLAGVKWAVLGAEETCTGDIARRAGHEFLFQMMAQANVDTLNRYGTTRIVTVCPHCYNTLKYEYPDFGGHYEVIHHADYLAQLVADGKLKPANRVDAKIVFHDSCYLGRYNDIYESPRKVLRSIPGLRLVEAEASGDRGMCCGAGGAQMFKEEEPGSERVNFARTRQLVETGADTIGTACPFCMRMTTDALNLTERSDIRQLDIAELLLESVADG